MVQSIDEVLDQRASKEISEADVDRILSISYLKQLNIIAAFLIVFYTALTLFHLRYSLPPENLKLAMISGSIAVLALGVFLSIKVGKLKPQLSHYMLLPVAILTTALTFYNVFVHQDLLILNRALMIIILTSLFVIHAGVYSSVILFVGVLYTFALITIPGEVANHTLVGLVIMLGSVGLFYSRRLALRRHARLSLMNSSLEKSVRDDEVSADRFLGTMSYELRTPLTGVMGMLDLLKSSDLEPTQKKYVDVADQSAVLLQHIINDILDMARLKAGDLQLVHQVFRPSQVADNILRIMNAEAAQKGISISFSEEGDIPDAVLGDLSRISQTLMNLVSNAIKNTSKGGVDITLHASRDNEQVDLRWSVTDMGQGLMEHEVDDIFERYENRGAMAKKDSDGSGLGLAISKAIIGLMGGEIGIESSVGKGSTIWFQVSLPLAESTELIDDGQAVELPIFDMHLTIVMAEDNPINQMLISKLLAEGKQWRVLKANNGEEAVEYVQSHNPDMVLMDIQMPVMDGVDATKAIRKLGENYATMPIIALTANALAEDEASYREAGMTDFIAKPINAELFYTAIARAAARKKL